MVKRISSNWRAAWALPSLLVVGQACQGAELSEMDFLSGGTTVLTASRLAQPVMDVPNAVTIIDRPIIEASGYHNLSDLFRLVPGMYVGQSNGWFHNVSHTMADEFARRMQVLVDGRSVYEPSIGGVHWDALPLAIDDIERIEVVRGPNAATFGANAYTGVINIITRHPEDVDRMVHVIVGDHRHKEAWFRWNGDTESTSHRITLGHREDGGFPALHDDERSNILNYRGEATLGPQKILGFQFGYLVGKRGDGMEGSALGLPHTSDTSSLFGQLDYRHVLSNRQEFLAKASYDYLHTNADVPVDFYPYVPLGSYYEVDLKSSRLHGEFQFNTQHSAELRSSVGGYLRQDSVQSLYYWNTDDKLYLNSKGAFGHVEWRMAPHWLLNTGAFLEDYPTVGWRLSPRLTLSWQPSSRHTLRAGISKAYRNPVLFESDADWRVRLKAPNGADLGVFGPYILATNDIKPEDILSQEISYLGIWPELASSLDIRVFHEHIGNFISAECPVRGKCDGLAPTYHRDFFNIGGGSQEGVEAQFTWRPSGNAQVIANYAFLRIDSDFDEKRYSPHHLAGLHLMYKFPNHTDLMVSHYWISSFEPIGQGVLPAARRLDVHLSKEFRWDDLQCTFAIGVENLGDSYHEFSKSSDNLFDTRSYIHMKVNF